MESELKGSDFFHLFLKKGQKRRDNDIMNENCSLYRIIRVISDFPIGKLKYYNLIILTMKTKMIFLIRKCKHLC